MKRTGVAEAFPIPTSENFGALIAGLVPPKVSVVEGPMPRMAEPLWPGEGEAVGNAVPKRLREFAAGRAFARRALGILGAPPAPLPANSDRSPRWPAGLVGSITHVANYCAVAVARAADVSAVGIDAEAWERFDPALIDKVFSPEETQLYGARLAREELRRVGALIFSAKEAIYKCLSVFGPVRLSFRDCTIEMEPEARVFAMDVPVASGIFARERRIVGRFAFAGALVGTAITLPPLAPTRCE